MTSNEIEEQQRRLLSGVLRFQEKVYPREKATYQRLIKEGQKPHTLFITCADSRIDPELITQSGPGELFVSRNIGNLVPPFGEIAGGISALVEYAVSVLQVCQIVVCGHTDCGAMIGLLSPEKVSRLSTVKSWLRHGETALSIVQKRNTAADDAAALEELIEENVLQQLHHLKTHPAVAGALAAGALRLCGWVFDIYHGDVRVFKEDQHKFVSLASDRPFSVRATS